MKEGLGTMGPEPRRTGSFPEPNEPGRCPLRSGLNYLQVIASCLSLANLAFNFLLILLTLPINPLFIPVLEFILRFNRENFFF